MRSITLVFILLLGMESQAFDRLTGIIIPSRATLCPPKNNCTAMEHLQDLSDKISDSPKSSQDLENSLTAIANFTELLMSGKLYYGDTPHNPCGVATKTYGIRKSGPTMDEWEILVKIAGRASQYLNRVFMSGNQPLKDRITERVFIYAFMSLTPEERLQPQYQLHSLGVLALLCGGGAAAHPYHEWEQKWGEFIQIGLDEAKKVGHNNAQLVDFMNQLQHLLNKATSSRLVDALKKHQNVDFREIAIKGINSTKWG